MSIFRFTLSRQTRSGSNIVFNADHSAIFVTSSRNSAAITASAAATTSSR
jgi:hypothetical protein